MTDYTSWHVGMKVVCVDDGPAGDGWQPPLVSGQVYVLRAISKHATGIGVSLEGVPDAPRRETRLGTYNVKYRAERFKPAHERKTDISIFTAMLHDKKERVE